MLTLGEDIEKLLREVTKLEVELIMVTNDVLAAEMAKKHKTFFLVKKNQDALL